MLATLVVQSAWQILWANVYERVMFFRLKGLFDKLQYKIKRRGSS